MKKIFKSPSAVFLLVVFLFSSITYNIWKDWRSRENPFQSDADQYYSYLVATFIHHDLEFKFPNSYWLRTPKEIPVPKVSMGMAYMYAPFFGIAHVVASSGDKYAADGYSKPYSYAIHWGGIIYTLLGLFFLRKLLLRFFGEWPTTLTLISIFFATNLFYYSLGWPLMPHCHLFFLYALLLYLTVKWHEKQDMKTMMGIGFAIGLCAVIRPLDALVGIIPVFYGVTSKETLFQKIQLLKINSRQLSVGFLFFWLPLIPQMIYWKWATGQFFFFSYGDEENFFFGDPQIMNFLFSYRKGWLLYTPIMVLALIGFVWMKRFKEFSYISLFYVLIMIYVLSSWWCWWFGGCFGMRAMVQSYAILALPMAAFYSYVYEKKYLKFIFSRLVFVFIYFNILQTWQYKKVTLHWDGVTKEVYWGVFGEWNRDNVDPAVFEKVKEPDYEKARKGERD
ncbi:MAG: hypothetical protein ACKOXB_09070 [Flavobacteriales bacterium]